MQALLENWQSLAALIASVVAVTGAAWRYVFRPAYVGFSKLARITELMETTMPTLVEIAQQFRPNCGGSLRDVIDRIERDLDMQRGRARAVLETSPIPMFEADESGECEWVNKRWCDLAGMTEVQARGLGWHTGIHQDDRERVHDEWEASVRDGRDFDCGYRFVHLDTGVVTHVRGFGRTVRDRKLKSQTYMGTIKVLGETQP